MPASRGRWRPGHYLRRLAAPAGASPTDAELLNRFIARRDADAFAALVQRHGPMVHGVCQRLLFHVHDAEDAFQATFLILARKAASIRRGQALAAWLHEVARRVAVQARQATDRRCVHERETLPMSLAQPLDTMDQEELRTVLDEELAALPRAYATFNPHATFELRSGAASWKRRVADGPWHKWRPDWPTSAHWYTTAVRTEASTFSPVAIGPTFDPTANRLVFHDPQLDSIRRVQLFKGGKVDTHSIRPGNEVMALQVFWNPDGETAIGGRSAEVHGLVALADEQQLDDRGHRPAQAGPRCPG